MAPLNPRLVTMEYTQEDIDRLATKLEGFDDNEKAALVAAVERQASVAGFQLDDGLPSLNFDRLDQQLFGTTFGGDGRIGADGPRDTADGWYGHTFEFVARQTP